MPQGSAVAADELLDQVNRLILYFEKMPAHPFLTAKNFARILFFQHSIYVGTFRFAISEDAVKSLFFEDISDRFAEDCVLELKRLFGGARLFFCFNEAPYDILEAIPMWFAASLLSEYWSKASFKESFALRQERSVKRAQALAEKEIAETLLNDFFLKTGNKSWHVLLRNWKIAA